MSTPSPTPTSSASAVASTPATSSATRPPTTQPVPSPRPTSQRPATPALAPTQGTACSPSLAGTKAHVAEAGNYLAEIFQLPVLSIIGVGSRSTPNSDHPKGLALDFPVTRALGDRLAQYVLDHQDLLSVSYVIWRQRINLGDGKGWTPMEDRGSPTANHFDHVHVSFRAQPDGAGPTC